MDSFEENTITEELLISVLNLDEILEEMKSAINETQNEKYLPAFKDFLSQLTVSCFSASGWDNQLMWAHYANSYSGICVEYDLSQMEEFCGFIYPVNYTSERPTVSLEDLGISIVQENDKVKVTQNEINIVPVFNYLLCKNECWSYENEWRIINIGEKNTPIFIDFPYIKSITFGLKIDENIKRLIIDICKSKSIDCYELTVNLENFNLDRTLIDFSNPKYDYNEDFEFENIDLTIKHMEIVSEYFDRNSDKMNEKFTIENFDYKFVKEFLFQLIDFLLDSYNLKISCNRIADNTTEDLSLLEDDEGILDMKKTIEETVENSKIIYTKLDKVFEVIRYSVYIPDGEFSLIRQLIKDVNNLSTQLENIEWKI